MKDSCFYPWCVYTNEGHSTLGRRVDKYTFFICDDVSSSWMGDKWENQAKQQGREKNPSATNTNMPSSIKR